MKYKRKIDEGESYFSSLRKMVTALKNPMANGNPTENNWKNFIAKIYIKEPHVQQRRFAK
jgi:hypothetical protein